MQALAAMAKASVARIRAFARGRPDGDVSSWKRGRQLAVFALGFALCVSSLPAVHFRISIAILLGIAFIELVLTAAERERLSGSLRKARLELQTRADGLSDLSAVDGMTGLANHRTFHEQLRADIARTSESGRPLSVMILDVDQFKRLNETYGHTAGDDVLRAVAKLATQCVRSGDLVARYGGEEFAVLLPGADADSACAAAERIRAAVEQYDFASRRTTVSIGVAVNGDLLDAETLMKRADHALYTAKHNGRNRVVVAEELHTERRCGATISCRSARLRVVSGGTDSASTRRTTASPGIVDKLDQEPGGQILAVMLALLDMRDSETEGHSQRVARFALRLADEIENQGIARVTERDRKELALGALLHDVGKIGVPDSVLKKPDLLTEHEWEIMRRHPRQGASLLARFPVMCDALPVVRHHHERWDGTGYPDRLSGDEIPLSARIFAMADTFDAMSSDRIYRRALPFPAICDEFRRVAGTQFDPDLVAAFLAIQEEEWAELRLQPVGCLGDWRLREITPAAEAA